MSRYISDHWYQVMKMIQESNLHMWFSADLGWCFITAKEQRIKITSKIAFSEAVEVVDIMKSAHMLRFDEETQKIKREPVKQIVAQERGGVFRIR
jgi:hypothetical protein